MGILNFELAKAIGLTLFHSIWQATLIALLMSVVLSMLSREKSRARYLVSISSLISLFAITIYTFTHYYQSASSALNSYTGDRLNSAAYENIIVLGNQYSLLAEINDLLMNNIHWITGFWILGLLFFLVKIGFGLRFTSRLASSSRMIEAEWIDSLLAQLKEKALFHKAIQIKESILISSPSIVGWLKPCIYFPIGLVNQISQEEAEAILAHEIAHIIRNDFLVNIIQSIGEAFFYFHPAVWWISANIRNEREHACDDLAIRIIGDKLKYAKSLVYLQEWESLAKPGLAMSFSNKETPLFDRIKRILNQPKNKHDMKQKILASLILLSSIIWISATDAKREIVVEVEEFELVEDVEVFDSYDDITDFIFQEIDTVPKTSNPTKSTIIELKNGRIKRLEIDGKEIPEDEFDEHQNLVKELKIDRLPEMQEHSLYFHPNSEELALQAETTRENFDELLAEMEIRKESFKPMLDENMVELHKLKEEWREDLSEQKELRNHIEEIDFPKFEYHYVYHDSLKHSLDSLRFQLGEFHFDFDDMATDIQIFIDSFDFPGMANDVHVYLDSFDFKGLGENLRMSLDSTDFRNFDNDYYFDFGSNLESVYKRELKKDGLFRKDGNDLKLSHDQLEINGETQSEEMLKKYKSIYEKKTGTKLLKGSNLHIELDNNSSNSNYKRI